MPTDDLAAAYALLTKLRILPPGPMTEAKAAEVTRLVVLLAEFRAAGRAEMLAGPHQDSPLAPP